MTPSDVRPAGSVALPPGWWWVEPGRILVGRHPARAVAEGWDPWSVLKECQIRHRVRLVEEAEERELPALACPPWLTTLDFPIPDFGLPEVPALVRFVRELGLGLPGKPDRVFVHCMGGCGRSGVVAAALLVAGGFLAADRVQPRLDQARRQAGLEAHCPETEAQCALVCRLGQVFRPEA